MGVKTPLPRCTSGELNVIRWACRQHRYSIYSTDSTATHLLSFADISGNKHSFIILECGRNTQSSREEMQKEKKGGGGGGGVVWLPGPAADGLQDKKFCGPHHEPQCA